ncbi:diguanylate cyclase [Methylorubrum sp. Q1]|uniref:sensor domain-containing diguanylate cyclase n=1 Tax=Methylorubrum sp. Q1 TaxID=2562453 RepID=UPI001075FB40|nr:sensor domain-containing diguanylate cyclase [Methylorubrum sp. Q1]TFZ58597.1 diguanylate cyclase [Methylorubrum sp. Q1]
MQLRIQAAIISAQRAALTRAEAPFEPALRVAGMGLWTCSLPDERLTWSDGVYDLFGLPRGLAIGRPGTLALYTDASRRRLTALRDRAIAEAGGFSLDAELLPAGGGHRWIRITATVESRNGRPMRLYGLKQDITEERRRLEEMRLQAETDALTGLANRACFDARLRAPLSALILIDLDDFKAINDTHGHPAGDRCLREAARRISLTCPRAELVARIGGDEFAVILDADATEAAACAERLVDVLGRPFDHGGRRYRLGASVGAALCRDVQDPFALADTALYAAKAEGRRTYRLFGAGCLAAASRAGGPPPGG